MASKGEQLPGGSTPEKRIPANDCGFGPDDRRNPPSVRSPAVRRRSGAASTARGAARPRAAMSQATIALRALSPTCIPSMGEPSTWACMVPESWPSTAPNASTRVAASNPARRPVEDFTDKGLTDAR